jgi:hypothetical protein
MTETGLKWQVGAEVFARHRAFQNEPLLCRQMFRTVVRGTAKNMALAFLNEFPEEISDFKAFGVD